MEIRQLKTFINIVKLGNFSQAAHFLGYTQSTVTTHIQLLEKELNCQLFERFGHQITLTEDGQRLYDYAERIVKLEEDAKNALNKSHIPRGPVVIGMLESLGTSKMPSILKEYCLLHPDVRLSLKFGTSSDFRTLLRKNVMDIAFMLEPSVSDSDLVSTCLWSETVVLVASPEHPLARLNAVQPSDLSDQTLVLVEAESHYRILLEETLSAAKIRPRSVLEVWQVQAIKQLVMQNLGLSILPLMAVRNEVSAGNLVVLPWQGRDFSVNVFMVHHKDKWVNYAMQAFIKLIRARLVSTPESPAR